jgi:hypothetical protein
MGPWESVPANRGAEFHECVDRGERKRKRMTDEGLTTGRAGC